jgi:hypothetical protein
MVALRKTNNAARWDSAALALGMPDRFVFVSSPANEPEANHSRAVPQLKNFRIFESNTKSCARATSFSTGNRPWEQSTERILWR